jgi:hypothetical protein
MGSACTTLDDSAALRSSENADEGKLVNVQSNQEVTPVVDASPIHVAGRHHDLSSATSRTSAGIADADQPLVSTQTDISHESGLSPIITPTQWHDIVYTRSVLRALNTIHHHPSTNTALERKPLSNTGNDLRESKRSPDVSTNTMGHREAAAAAGLPPIITPSEWHDIVYRRSVQRALDVFTGTDTSKPRCRDAVTALSANTPSAVVQASSRSSENVPKDMVKMFSPMAVDDYEDKLRLIREAESQHLCRTLSTKRSWKKK